MSDAEQAERIRHLEVENARLRRLLDQRGMPSALRHQVRNTLGLMRVILRRSAENKTTAEELAAHVDGRFDALLRVQTALLSSPDGLIDLAMLVADELLGQNIREGSEATIEGPTVRIEARQAELLGLALHELATNAVKFGRVTSGGTIEITWSVSVPPRRLTLVWTESGRHGAIDGASTRGFGTDTILGMLPYQLKAESRLELMSEGLRCIVTLPLADA